VVEDSCRAARAFMAEVRNFQKDTFAPLPGCEITTEPLEPEPARGAVGAALIAFARHFSISLEPGDLEYAR